MSQTGNHKTAIIDDLTRLYSLAQASHRDYPYFLKKPIAQVEISATLMAVDDFPRWYWKGRENKLEVAGFGTAISSSGLLDFECPCGDFPIIFSGGHFSSTSKGDQWNDFPDRVYAISKRMFIREDDNCYEALCIIVNDKSDIESSLVEAMEFISKPARKVRPVPDCILPPLESSRHYPDINGWRKNVASGLAAIASGEIEKVVLARQNDYKFEQPVDPVSLLRQLMMHNPESFALMFQPRPGIAFISLTPERLYRRSDDLIEIDALSSTVPRGDTTESDRRLEKELLENRKQRHEQQLVIDGIIAALSRIVTGEPAIGSTSVLKLDRIQHLKTPISGRLRSDIDDREILKALHPTPAVGGLPRDRAIDLINKLEPFDRGWYAGPIGVIRDSRAEFGVGIRSLLMHDDIISVFTGAGIVAGSDPEAEWSEIDSKNILHPLLAAQVAQ